MTSESRSWSSGCLDKAFRHSTHATLPLANVAVSSIVLQHVAVLAYCKELQMPLQLQLSTLNTTSFFCNTTSCFWRCVRMCVCVCVCYDVGSGLHNSLGVHLFRLLDSTIRYEHVSVASTAYNIHVAVFHSSEGTFDSSEHTPICNRASFLSTAIRTAPLRRIAVDGDLAFCTIASCYAI